MNGRAYAIEPMERSWMLSLEEGERAVRTARMVIKEYLRKHAVPKTDLDGVFDEQRGVFVTLNSFKKGKESALRGCIGYPEPVMRLKDALVSAAVSAATRDPRFSPVSKLEMERVTVEVSVLTQPEPMPSSPRELIAAVKVGRDGLIVEKGRRSGLLLPQVPVEYGWTSEEFLSHTCQKAGLPSDEWKTGECNFSSFQAQVFTEEAPRGAVVEKAMDA